MSMSEMLNNVNMVFLDTAPIIYYVEKKQPYFDQVKQFFDLLDAGEVTAVSSPITLAESLFYPYKQGNKEIINAFRALLTHGPHTQFVPVTAPIAEFSSYLRAQHNLGFADAIQVAVAIHAGCDTLLTNDKKLRRITELNVIVLGDEAN
jgi:predicted nucleic acid-binding protein